MATAASLAVPTPASTRTGCALLAACSTPSPPNAWRYSIPEPSEAASGLSEKPGWSYTRQAVAAANPLATDAGHQILRAGGSALDAAIAVQLVLGLVEPQSSGIGGGAFLMHFDGQRVQAFDGREVAPASAQPDMLMAQGKPLPFDEAVLSGHAVGVPGAVRMLEAAHRQHGQLPWAQLFEAAIALAEAMIERGDEGARRYQREDGDGDGNQPGGEQEDLAEVMHDEVRAATCGFSDGVTEAERSFGSPVDLSLQPSSATSGWPGKRWPPSCLASPPSRPLTATPC